MVSFRADYTVYTRVLVHIREILDLQIYRMLFITAFRWHNHFASEVHQERCTLHLMVNSFISV